MYKGRELNTYSTALEGFSGSSYKVTNTKKWYMSIMNLYSL